ncbi:unnamed protein product [Brachionus calyciflorus]|uniref:HAT C-terminal dimerisation domain-containing protein n=1 Tax=Brachionus calyciflorus TaxID=104777 RepID=A0A813P519_9BILA|nr:unnamed protein product [Brachionus calyciflorus]
MIKLIDYLPDITHIPCLELEINNLVKNNLINDTSYQLNNLISRCRKLVGIFWHSYKLSEQQVKLIDQLDNIEPEQAKNVSSKPKEKASEFSLLSNEQTEEYIKRMSFKKSCIGLQIENFLKIKDVVKETSCSLQFFKNHNSTLPILSEISRIVFSATSTSVLSECLFGKAAEIITIKRNKLTPELDEKLILLGNDNIFVSKQ